MEVVKSLNAVKGKDLQMNLILSLFEIKKSCAGLGNVSLVSFMIRAAVIVFADV